MDKSANSQTSQPDENSGGDLSNAAAPEAEKSRTLEEIFAEDVRESEQTENSKEKPDRTAEGENQKAPKSFKDLNALAEHLKIKAEDLYKVVIPFAEGKSMTLGEIKDLAKKETDFDAREMLFEERRVSEEAKLIRAKAEVEEILSAIPTKALNKQVVENIRQRNDAHVVAQRRETLNLIPDWKDEKTRVTEMEEMVTHLKGYGFSGAEFKMLVDARTIKYIRDNWLREKRVKAILERVQKVNTKTVAPSKTTVERKSAKTPPKESTRTSNSSSENKLRSMFSED